MEVEVAEAEVFQKRSAPSGEQPGKSEEQSVARPVASEDRFWRECRTESATPASVVISDDAGVEERKGESSRLRRSLSVVTLDRRHLANAHAGPSLSISVPALRWNREATPRREDPCHRRRRLCW